MDKYKIGYNFDGSGRYTGTELVYLEKATGTYPHAANVVFDEPPALREHEGAYWSGAWTTRPDEGYIEDSGTIREMTIQEKVDAGLETVPDGMKIEGGEIVPKTIDDLYDEGELTIEQYNAEIDRRRAERYAAETDKIGLMVLRGEATLEEWTAAMDAIRAELPKK